VCTVLDEARSSFYHAAALTVTQVADVRLGDLIETVFQRHRRRYGYRRIMAQRGLQAVQPRFRCVRR